MSVDAREHRTPIGLEQLVRATQPSCGGHGSSRSPEVACPTARTIQHAADTRTAFDPFE